MTTSEPVTDRPVAAIDCGTNSTRLLIAGADGHTVERLMNITRLGEGVDRTGALVPEAIERTVAVLGCYRRVMDHHRVGNARMTATSAARDALNRDAFFAAAQAAVGLRPELLDGEAEGTLSFAGATAELDPAEGPWLVADIGGGSTELATGPSADPQANRLLPLAVRSLDMGCVRVTERFFGQDPPRAWELRAAKDHVGALLAEASRASPAFGAARRLVGLAGTVSAVAALSQGLGDYQREKVHHHVIGRSEVECLLATLSAESASARRRRPGMEADRADVIVGGLVVLASIMAHFGFEDCLVSEADILDGLAMTLR